MGWVAICGHTSLVWCVLDKFVQVCARCVSYSGRQIVADLFTFASTLPTRWRKRLLRAVWLIRMRMQTRNVFLYLSGRSVAEVVCTVCGLLLCVYTIFIWCVFAPFDPASQQKKKKKKK